MKSIAIYCGSSKGHDPIYAQAAQRTGELFAAREIELIYGAGNVGLMGEVADAALAKGGKVCGIIPEFLKNWEVYHRGITELIVTETMHQRKQIMADRSEGFIALPGGFGTLDELFEIATWGQLRLHAKPIGILNVNGYYDGILAHMKHMTETGFLKLENKNMIAVSDNIEDLLAQMSNMDFKATDKWIK